MAGSTKRPAPSSTDTPATALGVRLFTVWLNHGRESLLALGLTGQNDGDLEHRRPRGSWAAAFLCTGPELQRFLPRTGRLQAPQPGLQAAVSPPPSTAPA